MSEFKFSCPQCGQHILCEALWSGREINCPACQQSLVVPSLGPPVPEVTTTTGPRIGRFARMKIYYGSSEGRADVEGDGPVEVSLDTALAVFRALDSGSGCLGVVLDNRIVLYMSERRQGRVRISLVYGDLLTPTDECDADYEFAESLIRAAAEGQDVFEIARASNYEWEHFPLGGLIRRRLTVWLFGVVVPLLAIGHGVRTIALQSTTIYGRRGARLHLHGLDAVGVGIFVISTGIVIFLLFHLSSLRTRLRAVQRVALAASVLAIIASLLFVVFKIAVELLT